MEHPDRAGSLHVALPARIVAEYELIDEPRTGNDMPIRSFTCIGKRYRFRNRFDCNGLYNPGAVPSLDDKQDLL